MHDAFTIRGRTFSPALFCAPVAGYTHSAFRRLVSDFGGYGALYTELLSCRYILREDASVSTFLKRRPEEGNVIYQLLLTARDSIPEIVDRILPLEPAGIDVNCGCAAGEIKRAGGGVSLFADKEALRTVLSSLRKTYQGPLSVKCRLGDDTAEWQREFIERLRIMEDCGVDFIAVHPRFANQHRRRTARHDLFNWITQNTRLPVIANGDLTGPQTVAGRPGSFACTSGIMVGRMALVQPWIFAAWDKQNFPVDYIATWQRFYNYVQEDFEPAKQLVPLKLFGQYFSRNFVYSHFFNNSLRNAGSAEEIHLRAMEFLSTAPAVTPDPSVSGI